MTMNDTLVNDSRVAVVRERRRIWLSVGSAAVVAVVGVAALIGSRSYPYWTPLGPGPGFFPRWLGGILVEMRAEAGGPVHIVAGFGINVRLDESAREAVSATGNTADDIQAHATATPDRNRIVIALLEQLVPALADRRPRSGGWPSGSTGWFLALSGSAPASLILR